MDVGAFLILCLLMVVANWVVLMIVVPFAQKITNGTMLLWGEASWKLAVVAGAITLVGVPMQRYGIFGTIAEALVLWALMWKWFDTEWLGLVIIVLSKGFLGMVATFAILALLNHP